jgi:deazaflavin-dependent oxidoreductase (nitroreductase family)
MSSKAERIRDALALDLHASGRAHTVDITTTGARTGLPRRIEIWFYHFDGRWFLSGLPGPSSWYANLLAHPDFTFHLKHGVHADLSARARPITDAGERRQLFDRIVEVLNLRENPARVPQPVTAAELIDASPLIEGNCPQDPMRLPEHPAT